MITKALKTVIENTTIPKLEEELKVLREYRKNFIISCKHKLFEACLKCCSISPDFYECSVCLEEINVDNIYHNGLIIGCKECSPELSKQLQMCDDCSCETCARHMTNGVCVLCSSQHSEAML